MKQTAVEWLISKLQQSKDWQRVLNEVSQMSTVQFNLLDQAKAMEKEQMCAFAEFVATYSDKNKNINGQMLHAKSKYDGAERTIDLLETFKSE